MRGKICYHGLVKYTIFIFYVSGMAVPIDQILWTKVNKSQSTLKNECTKTTVQKCANGFISKVKQNWMWILFLIIINAILNLVLRTRVSAWIFLIYHNHYFWFDVILFSLNYFLLMGRKKSFQKEKKKKKLSFTVNMKHWMLI